MKKKIRFIDNLEGTIKTRVVEIESRATDHFEAQQKYKAQVFNNKKKVLPRHHKYKNKDIDF